MKWHESMRDFLFYYSYEITNLVYIRDETPAISSIIASFERLEIEEWVDSKGLREDYEFYKEEWEEGLYKGYSYL